MTMCCCRILQELEFLCVAGVAACVLHAHTDAYV